VFKFPFGIANRNSKVSERLPTLRLVARYVAPGRIRNITVPLSPSNDVDGTRDDKRNDDECKDCLEHHEKFRTM
jgi:hypothetical protein